MLVVFPKMCLRGCVLGCCFVFVSQCCATVTVTCWVTVIRSVIGICCGYADCSLWRTGMQLFHCTAANQNNLPVRSFDTENTLHQRAVFCHGVIVRVTSLRFLWVWPSYVYNTEHITIVSVIPCLECREYNHADYNAVQIITMSIILRV